MISDNNDTNRQETNDLAENHHKSTSITNASSINPKVLRQQKSSGCENNEEEMAIVPLELEDLRFRRSVDDDNDLKKKTKEESIVGGGKPAALAKNPMQPRFSQPLVNKWRWASRAVLQRLDPWIKYRIVDLYPEEECIRHRYSAYRQQWVVDRVRVKMQLDSFGRGAMRECFRLKKLPGGLLHQVASGEEKEMPPQHGVEAWSKALNYVSKRYINEVERQTYFDDVKLQADAKLWSEEFNRHNPPKKIDIMQVSILEFPDRPGRPLYHLEHFIEGEYIKYNSNSGFVSDQARQTPQAFSHFTFERSGHQLIVVDVQGVGDLYTDPQIHTADSKTYYGDGDLSTRGMALFFHTHQCNSICDSMNLTPFDLSPSEYAALNRGSRGGLASNSQTVCSRDSIEMCQTPSFSGSERIMNLLRQRTLSKPDPDEGEDDDSVHFTIDTDHDMESETGSQKSDASSNQHQRRQKTLSATAMAPPPSPSPAPPPESIFSSRRRVHYSSNSDMLCESGYGSSEYSASLEVESDQWKDKMEKLRKPSCVPGKDSNASSGGFFSAPRDESTEILGALHLDLVRYYEMGRFNTPIDSGSGADGKCAQPVAFGITDKIEYDKASAWFHLDMAARCGILEAIITMAKIYLGLPHDILKDFVLEHDSTLNDEDDEEALTHIDHGIDLMEDAAHRGDRSCMLYLAEAYECGKNLGNERQMSWIKSIDWYEKAIKMQTDEELMNNESEPSKNRMGGCGGGSSTWNDSVPRYKILAKVAEMYHNGGPMLSPNLSRAGELYSEAAEAATEAMQGKLASKLFMLAEEAWAGVEEEEE